MMSRNRSESRVAAPTGRRHTLRATFCIYFYTPEYISKIERGRERYRREMGKEMREREVRESSRKEKEGERLRRLRGR